MGKHRRPQVQSGLSLAASFNSQGTLVDDNESTSIQFVWSGGSTPVGTVKIQMSNDLADKPANVTNWTDITGSSTAVTGNTGSIAWNVVHSYRFLRMVYTKTSGSATTASVQVQSKRI